MSRKYIINELIFLIIIGFLFNPFYVISQYNTIKFEYITADDGLSDNIIHYIYRDSKDYLWIGTTNNGLNKYDGNKITIYKNVDEQPGSISKDAIRYIFEDHKNNLWIGTTDGLNLYNPKSESFNVFRLDYTDTINYHRNYVTCIIEDKKGTIWITYIEGLGLAKWDYEKKKFTRYLINNSYDDYSANSMTSIREDSKGNLWIASKSPGIYRFNPESGSFKAYNDQSIDFIEKTNKKVYIDHDDNIWIGSYENGLSLFNPSTGKFKHFGTDIGNKGLNSNLVSDIIQPDDHHLLIATDQGGINRFDMISETFEYISYDEKYDQGLNSNGILCLYHDREGILWVGTSRGGVNYYNPKRYKFKLFKHNKNPNSLSYNIVGCFYEDSNGLIWIGTDGGGVNVYDPKTGNYKIFKHDPSNPHSISGDVIRCISEDKDGDMWIGTWDAGLNRYDKKTKKFYHYFQDKNDPSSISSNTIWHLKIDHNNNIWLGNYSQGVEIFNKKKGVVKRFSANPDNPKALSSNDIMLICEDSKQNIWICTYNGINLYDSINNSFTVYKDFPDNHIGSFCRDKEGKLWAGSVNRGLFLFKQDGTIVKTYDHKNGLPDNTIHAIVEDDHGNLWISTNKGISQFNQKTKKFRNYDISDGLQGNIFFQQSFLKTKNGEIYFGGYNGFNSFHPDSIKDNDYKPEVYITGFKLFNKPVLFGIQGSPLQKPIGETKEIILSHRESVFSFEFTAINFTHPEKNEYAYIMEGFEKKWNYVGNKRDATYTNMDAGEYVFKVKASNNDGIWNEKGTSIRIIVLPPWWKTWWFIFLVLVFIGGSIYFWYWYKTNSIQRQKKILEKQVKERTAEISEKNIELEKLSIVASKTDNAIAIMDAQGNFEWFNNAYVKLYGYELEEFKKTLGKNIIEISTNPNIQSLINQCIQDKKTVTYECESSSKTGNKIWTNVTITPILDTENNVAKLITIESDIQKLKEYEAEILNKNEELAIQHEAIEEQNKELESHRNHLQKFVNEQTKELKAALYKAKESDRLKTSFLTNMSHEIRTPMNAIIGFSEILIKMNKDETQKEYLNSIKLSGQTLLSLINDILDLSRIEAGKMTIKKDIISIKNIFSELEHIFKIDAELKGLNLFTEVDENFPEFIELDELRTRQVLINLINNAIKFTHKGYIKVKASAEFIREKVNLMISVQDTGIGIKKSDQEKIFEAFNQSDSYDTRNYEGTGLGLAIISRIVHLLGGTIRLDSKINKGSIFTIEIKDVKIHKERLVSKLQENIDPDCISFEAGTILVVDDKDVNIKVTKGLLKPYNLEIIEANSGIEAIDVAMLKKPDLILMDLKMKEMSGYEATKFLKSNETTRNIPVIILTASVLGFNENVLDKYKFSGYLPKPVDLTSLVTELSRFLPHKIAPKHSQEDIADKEVNLLVENNELKNYLKDHVLNVWEQLQASRTSILEKEFAWQIIKAGQLFKNKYLEEKGQALDSAIKNFNIEKFTTVQDELGSIFNKIIE